VGAAGAAAGAGAQLLDCVGAAVASTLAAALAAPSPPPADPPSAARSPAAPAANGPAAAAGQQPEGQPAAPAAPAPDGARAHAAFARAPALLAALRQAAEGALGAGAGAEEVRFRVCRPAAAAVLPAVAGGDGGAPALALLALLIRAHGAAAGRLPLSWVEHASIAQSNHRPSQLVERRE
jgi:pyruvate dehydrogenase E2 component (dihydrolipoamide acetyltransferase)